MKKSGAPEVGDLVRYCHKVDNEVWDEITALVIREKGIWVRILPLNRSIPEHHRHSYFGRDKPGSERWIKRTQCEIISS